MFSEYYLVVTVPAGARSVYVREMEVSTSYLAVRSVKRKYHLTGDWTVDWPGKFQFGGATFHYQRSFNHPESLYAAGPTNETLVFEVSVPPPPSPACAPYTPNSHTSHVTYLHT